MSEHVIHVGDVTFAYRDRAVLRGVTAAVDAGEMVAMLGPNGAGKTTLLKIMVGLVRPDHGLVTAPPTARVGWVPQRGATYARLTVQENLELFARLLRLSEPPAQVAARAARDAELEPWFTTLGSSLSGGLRQRLNVAVGLLGEPQLLVLDEPTTGVDLRHRAALFDVLRARANDGCAVLYTAHSVEDASAADRVLVLANGRIRHDGLLADLARHPLPDDGSHVGHAGRLDPVSAGLLRVWADDAAGDT